MRTLQRMSGIALLLLLAVVVHGAPQLTVGTDREMPVYRCGEPATFTVAITEDGKPLTRGHARLVITCDGGRTIAEQELDFSRANPATVPATLDEPGFLRAEVREFRDLEKPRGTPRAGAAFDPEKITMGFPCPDDFDRFWEDGRSRLPDTDVVLRKIDRLSTAEYTSYRLTVDVLHGEKLYGFLCVPTGKGPFPALVCVPGAGPGYEAPSVNWAKQGVIVLNMNVHKYEVSDTPGEFRRQYDEYNRKLGQLYCLDHCTDRERYHYRNVILGIDRAIDFVSSLPEWDGRHLVIDGFSQGGALALILAGFNRHITAAGAAAPALCDHGGARFGRQPGWPRLVKQTPASVSVVPYYDAGNFAARIRVPVLALVGFIDTTCPPGSVYAAFNQINAPKKMVHAPRHGHSVPGNYRAIHHPWLLGQLGLAEPVEPTRQ